MLLFQLEQEKGATRHRTMVAPTGVVILVWPLERGHASSALFTANIAVENGFAHLLRFHAGRLQAIRLSRFGVVPEIFEQAKRAARAEESTPPPPAIRCTPLLL